MRPFAARSDCSSTSLESNNVCDYDTMQRLFEAEGIELGVGAHWDEEDMDTQLVANEVIPKRTAGISRAWATASEEDFGSRGETCDTFCCFLLRNIIRQSAFHDLSVSSSFSTAEDVSQTMQLTSALRTPLRQDFQTTLEATGSWRERTHELTRSLRSGESVNYETSTELMDSINDLHTTIVAATWHDIIRQERLLEGMSIDAQAALLTSTLCEYVEDEAGNTDVRETSLGAWNQPENLLQTSLDQASVAYTESLASGSEPDMLRMIPDADPRHGPSGQSNSHRQLDVSEDQRLSPTSLSATSASGSSTMRTLSLTGRLAGALAGSEVADGQSVNAGIVDILRLLVTDGALEESFSGSVRHVQQVGTVAAGKRLSLQEINSLPKVTFRDVEQQTCSICLEGYQTGEVLTRLACCHSFHVNCIASWLQQANCCPLCRSLCADDHS